MCCQGTASDSHPDLPDDRPISDHHARVASHPHAGAVRSVPLHGRSFPQGSTVLRQDTHHVHASQVSAGLHVLEEGWWIFVTVKDDSSIATEK